MLLLVCSVGVCLGVWAAQNVTAMPMNNHKLWHCMLCEAQILQHVVSSTNWLDIAADSTDARGLKADVVLGCGGTSPTRCRSGAADSCERWQIVGIASADDTLGRGSVCMFESPAKWPFLQCHICQIFAACGICTSTSWLGSAAQSKDAHCWKAGVVACLWWHPTTDAGLVQLVIGIMEQIVVIALWVGVVTCYEAGNNVTMKLMVHHHVVICGKLVGSVVDAV